MRRFLLAGWLALASALSLGTMGASGGIGVPGFYIKAPSAAPAYTGPGDLATFTAWGGMRAYDAAQATAGAAAFDWTCTNGSTFTGTVHVTSSGGLNATNISTVTSDCSSATVTITQLYDQTGNGHPWTQATSADQPTIVLSCLNSKPCIKSANNTAIVLVATSFTPNSSNTSSYSIVGYATAASGIFLAENGSSGNALLGLSTQWELIGGASGTITPTVSASAWHVAGAVINGASSVLNIDGTETTGTVTGNHTAGTPLAAKSPGSAILQMVEGGFIDNTAISSTVRSNLCHNAYTYWGTSTSC